MMPGAPEPAAPGAAGPQPGSALAIPGSAPQGAMVSPIAAPVPMEVGLSECMRDLLRKHLF